MPKIIIKNPKAMEYLERISVSSSTKVKAGMGIGLTERIAIIWFLKEKGFIKDKDFSIEQIRY